MKRRVIAGILVALAVAGGIATARRLFERVPVTIRRGASAEVRKQPRLAFERLLDAGLFTADIVDVGVAAVGEYPLGATLMLTERDLALTRATEDALLFWVRIGGTLVLEPSYGALSQRLGVREPDRRAVSFTTDGTYIEPPTTVTIQDPQHETPFTIETPSGFLLSTPPLWSSGDGHGGLAIAYVPHGEGVVILVAGLSTMWHNEAIGRHEHAALLWHLATRETLDGLVLLADTAVPELEWQAVARTGWPVVTAACVLAVLALWRVLPRPGLVFAPPAPERRELGAHLDALARFQVRDARFSALTVPAQRAVAQHLRRRPWDTRPGDNAAIAATPATPVDFLDTIQRLRHIWRRLHRI
ncbi:MAG: hypothetical protein IT182_12985 [Acidobacteria bacterium]|nr:hypothetical protein [Acidobacteriota bacterium]